MSDDEDFVVLRATIGARMQSGQSADGIARELWKQGYREKATTARRQLEIAREGLKTLNELCEGVFGAGVADSILDAIKKEGE